jgi:cephalosporin hydroxylase
MSFVPAVLAIFGILLCYLAYVLFAKTKEGAPETVFRGKVLSFVVAVLIWAFGLYQFATYPSDAKMIRRFQDIYLTNHDQTWETLKWLNIDCGQHPQDAWMHQEIISTVKPDFIIEAGTWKGASAAMWAMIQDQVNPEGRVITIDIRDHGIDYDKAPILKKKVDFIQGSSIDPKVVEDIKKRVAGKKVLVILDSVHTKEHVLAELRAYSPMVSLGSYILVQDTDIPDHPTLKSDEPGSRGAVEAFLKENDQFEPDRWQERLMFTTMSRGYLKRVK